MPNNHFQIFYKQYQNFQKKYFYIHTDKALKKKRKKYNKLKINK